ncbi:2-oxo-4-hydroxy-4-carboxy-5-ureidoimidazoline decarboxylase-like [Phlebotomus argentipes]|uniref:2-oxo-4-hydroxy-4-carboxy-5-ureidoimidazoline decarboxylase-like n=1 Tax=Phlebotomus argentipes TaxID=94469 RepID=UPI002892DBA9|nr:2-oxo-4-hydroxy-4-carboxy-5-ureidoimidazoline decarboxylase-like [Phlebotomus argentipes]
MKFTLEEINQLEKVEFEEVFKNVVECFPDAAKNVSNQAPFATFFALLEAFMQHLDQLDPMKKLEIVKLHPHLVPEINKTNLTDESASEQSTVGLNRITSEEKKVILRASIENYWKKFNFPFVICVRECKSTDDIISAVQERLSRTPEEEVQVAFEHVKKITSLRIADIVSH